ncbi:MAG: OmpA family protein [Atribacterota bacterium]|nr:OmpA family protein [Atribacterota bacterium]MDD4895633.1 OmpA family protein [Atribacterota bacterium]MDD5637049.1 OmpA family protein [Atribacterota bacterium]
MKYLRLLLFFITLFLLITTIPASAADIPEHPFIRPFPGSVLAENMSKYANFDSYKFYVTNAQTQKREEVEIKGKKWQLLYEVRTPSGERVRNISKLEFFENYKAAALERGGKIVFEDQGQMVLTIPRDDGGITWCRVSGNAGLGQQELVIIDEEGFKKSLTFGPAELKEVLDSEGRIILYDILFDYDKTTLKQESDKQLQHIVTLLLQNPELKVEIQGHTDNEGEEAYNLTLSDKRANTVLQYLQLFGISSERLLSKGYGESQPVSSNDTEEGRAKNRRVELVKM